MPHSRARGRGSAHLPPRRCSERRGASRNRPAGTGGAGASRGASPAATAPQERCQRHQPCPAPAPSRCSGSRGSLLPGGGRALTQHETEEPPREQGHLRRRALPRAPSPPAGRCLPGRGGLPAAPGKERGGGAGSSTHSPPPRARRGSAPRGRRGVGGAPSGRPCAAGRAPVGTAPRPPPALPREPAPPVRPGALRSRRGSLVHSRRLRQ